MNKNERKTLKKFTGLFFTLMQVIYFLIVADRKGTHKNRHHDGFTKFMILVYTFYRSRIILFVLINLSTFN